MPNQFLPQAPGRGGWTGDFNQLFSQMNPPESLASYLTKGQIQGFGNFGNQLQGAMGQIGAINSANQQASLANKKLMADIDMARNAGVGAEEARQRGRLASLTQLSPLLEKLFGYGGITGGGGLGFKAFGPGDDNPFAQASFGGSNVAPLNMDRYRPRPRPNY